ncbi:MAG: cellulose 1,4-beta-cellobiosidase [Solirubrobacteraceae bacterium]|nr:cellulose 1,4-beta-cellobiosidase [Solirubrobacteraceae bacterium]
MITFRRDKSRETRASHHPTDGRRYAAAAALGFALLLAAAPASAVADQTASGTLQVVHSDYFPRAKATFSYYLKTRTGRRVALRFRKNAPRDAGGARMSIRGTKVGKRLVVRRSRIRRKSRAASTSATPTTHKVAVVLLNFSNDTSQPFTTDAIRSLMFTSPSSVANYFKEESWQHLTMAGKLRADGDVFGWYTIPSTNAGCAWSSWASAAKTAATNAGVNLTGYDHIVYVWPRTTSCGWAGLAYMPGTSAYINGDFNLRVVGHELSHNLGGDHASSYSCTNSTGQRVSISSTCSLSEYGDPFDILGSSSRHGSNFHIGQFGWLAPSNTQTVSTSGTYTLTAIEPDSGQPQVLRIPRATSVQGSQEYYSLEYRQPYGTYFDNFSAGDPAVNGVTIRIVPDYSVIQRPLLVDTTPATTTFTDAPLGAGKTFDDATNKISVTTVSLSPLAATVQVDLSGTGGPPPPPPTDTTAPTAPSSLTGQAVSGPAVALSWSASSDNVGVTGYRVFRDGTQLTSTAATSYSDAAAAAGTTHTYYVVAYDAAGNVSPTSNQVTVTVPAGTPTTSYKASPSSLTIYSGSLYAGTVADLATNNGVFLKISSTTTSPVADWYGLITSVPTTAKNLSVVYWGKNTVACNQTLRIYNYELSRWDTLDTRSVDTTVTSITAVPPAAPADYNSNLTGTGNVAVRVTCSGPTAQFRSVGDLLRIKYDA